MWYNTPKSLLFHTTRIYIIWRCRKWGQPSTSHQEARRFREMWADLQLPMDPGPLSEKLQLEHQFKPSLNHRKLEQNDPVPLPFRSYFYWIFRSTIRLSDYENIQKPSIWRSKNPISQSAPGLPRELGQHLRLGNGTKFDANNDQLPDDRCQNLICIFV